MFRDSSNKSDKQKWRFRIITRNGGFKEERRDLRFLLTNLQHFTNCRVVSSLCLNQNVSIIITTSDSCENVIWRSILETISCFGNTNEYYGLLHVTCQRNTRFWVVISCFILKSGIKMVKERNLNLLELKWKHFSSGILWKFKMRMIKCGLS